MVCNKLLFVIIGLGHKHGENISALPEGGSSGNGCDETYHGTAAFSEPESAHVRDAILSVASRSKAYLTYHSYGQYWLTPWGYTAELPSDYYYLVNKKTIE